MTTTDDFTRRIRPYFLTAGRTRPDVDLPVEAQLRTASNRAVDPSVVGPEAVAILDLCEEPHAVADVAAHLGVHLQVAKILVGDLLAAGLLVSGEVEVRSRRHDLGLLERVLDGLQTL
ncbi:MAG: DUF742 domain-containing protein [Actinomycetota bacterium]